MRPTPKSTSYSITVISFGRPQSTFVPPPIMSCFLYKSTCNRLDPVGLFSNKFPIPRVHFLSPSPPFHSSSSSIKSRLKLDWLCSYRMAMLLLVVFSLLVGSTESFKKGMLPIRTTFGISMALDTFFFQWSCPSTTRWPTRFYPRTTRATSRRGSRMTPLRSCSLWNYTS